ncbi:MAG: hemolysin III family protein [Pseudomonadota bacterium]
MYPSEIARERAADGAVHVLGLSLVTISAISLMVGAATQFHIGMTLACAVYCTCVLASFASSATYHLLPRHEWRRTLRRLDHTAIYAMIAGTFTPLLVYIGSTWAFVVLVAVWTFAIPAMIYKLVGDKIEPRWSLASYLALGWMGVFAAPEFYEHLPPVSIAAIFTGGFFYTFGTIFYARKKQVFRYAIWHIFVLLGTASFFVAVWTTVF